MDTSKIVPYIIVGAFVIIVVLLYGESREKAGYNASSKEWMAKLSAPAETTVVTKTVKLPPETLRVTKTVTVYRDRVIHEPSLECSAFVIFDDTLGGSHEITVDSGEVSEVFNPGPQKEREVTVVKLVPINDQKNFLIGLGVDYGPESEGRWGISGVLGIRPVYLAPRYYPKTNSWQGSVGVMYEF